MEIGNVTSPRLSHRVVALCYRILGSQADALLSRFGGGALWALAGAIGSQALVLVGNFILARILGVGSYGAFGMLQSTVNLFSAVALLGLSTTASKYVAQYRNANPAMAGRVIGLSSIAAIAAGAITASLLVVFAPEVCNKALNAPNLVPEVRLCALASLLVIVNGHQAGALGGFEAFRSLTFASIARGVVFVPIVCGGAYLAGLRGAVLSLATVAAASFIIFSRALRKQCAASGVRVSYRFTRADLSLLWKFSLPAAIASFMFAPAAWWTQAALLADRGMAEAGVFNAAFQWRNALLFVTGAVSVVGLPMLSNAAAGRDLLRYKRLLWLDFLATSTPAVILALPLAIAAPLVLRIYGPGFSSGVVALRLICVFAVLSALNEAVGHVLWSLGYVRVALGVAALRGLVLLFAAHGWLRLGAAGLALAYVAVTVVQTAVQVPLLVWLLDWRRPTWDACKLGPAA